MNTHRSMPPRRAHVLAQAAALALGLQLLDAQASSISTVPLASSAAGQARANLMFDFDNSGSMAWDYIPDNSGNYGPNGSTPSLCFGYNGVNLVFYTPTITYVPPIKADGTLYPAATFTAAYNNGYAQSGSTTNLSNVANLSTPSVQVGVSGGNKVNSQFYYATYASTNTPSTPVCSGSGYDYTKWTIVTTLPAAQQQNYANWWSYYRTRVNMMKSSIGYVVSGIDPTRFRIGLNTINTVSSQTFNTTYAKTSPIFLPVSEFDQGTQKTDFYSYLYSVTAGGSTPTRAALEKMGKYYAGRQLNGTALPSGTDPVQYSCQRNFTILTTDGYWNTGGEPSGYTPTKLDGTTPIGNTDGPGATYYDGTVISRPRLDDGHTVSGSWVTGGSGVSNSMADIAEYFFVTDLRASSGTNAAPNNCIGAIANQDVCADNVPYEYPPTNLPVERVRNQRMTTYTMGLGVAGVLNYQPDYDTATSGDFYHIKQGSLAWPDPQVSSSSSSVTARLDDLWHAAVNGRGRYYSAGNPAAVQAGLSDALQNIAAVTGTAAAAATSTQLPVTGDNYAFLGQYTTVTWDGNVKAYTIDPSTGAIQNLSSPLWEAKNTVLAQVAAASDTRTIWFRNTAAGATNLSAFTYTNLNTAGFGSNFVNMCQTGSYKLSQCASLAALGASVQAAANDGNNFVNYLRGQSGNEASTTNPTSSGLYRWRPNTPLGDVVNAAPVYAKKPPFTYTESIDPGYAAYQSSNASRTPVVYVAANDGMLHAFNASTGVELWAYVPTAVIPNLYKLADANYAHAYYVDGSPVVGDVFDGSNWRTILVGGLAAGGRSYYALDITNPASPISLWEFSVSNDSDLGYTFGNPVITKNKAGTWIVAFSSGYNNVSPGSGNGALYVVNAVSGALISKIPTYTTGTTPAGTTALPNEVGKINPWIDTATNNLATRFYGGDMLGYLWRFDFDGNIAPVTNKVIPLGRALTSGGAVQPITTKPITFKGGNVSTVPVVAFGTGRYLGTSDVGDNTVQSLYAVKDPLTTSGLGTLRSDPKMVLQVMSSTRTLTTSSVDWSSKDGWYFDFNSTVGGTVGGTLLGERVNVDPVQTGSLLVVATNIPSPTACNPGGDSVLYDINTASGALTDTPLTYTTLTAGLNLIKPAGVLKVIRWDTTGNPTLDTPTLPPPATGSATRRASWRELVN